MSGYSLFLLKDMLKELGEDSTKNIVSSFLCPMNPDVENFLHFKAIEFERRGYATTYLVYASYKQNPELAGYFSLAQKQFTIADKSVRAKSKTGKTQGLSKALLKKIAKFGTHDKKLGIHTIPAPLIGQLGKNYAVNGGRLITGDELLKIACDKVWEFQRLFSGRVVYLECEDKPKLIDFYSENGFVEFGKRYLDPDENDVDGDYLVQMLKDLKAFYEKS
ncbi:MAG: N-acetyltransferase [Defluviitaleaceae bacterium]|nr:N-acetyltransferase [Defluviitaleaceae bacterium]